MILRLINAASWRRSGLRKSILGRTRCRIYVPTFVPCITAHPLLWAAAPDFAESQRRLWFPDTTSSPETTIIGHNYLSSTSWLLPSSYFPGAKTFDYCFDGKNAPHCNVCHGCAGSLKKCLVSTEALNVSSWLDLTKEITWCNCEHPLCVTNPL